MSNESGPKATRFLHPNQIFDVIIEKRDYDFENLFAMKKPAGVSPFKLDMWSG